ncbi:MAG TPA: response regulator [Aliidongia sp.]|nr:response regulator [Aliidongia sp.]
MASSEPNTANPPRLLVVHEDTALRARLSALLAARHRVESFAEPPEASACDLILSDRDFRAVPSSPLILLRQPTGDEIGRAAIDDFLALPFADAELEARVGLALERASRNAAIRAAAEAEEMERMRTDQTLRDSQERLARLLEVTPIGIIELSVGGNVTFVNPAAERLLRIGRTEAEGRFYLSAEIIRTTPEGEPIPPDQFPIARALRGETVSGYEIASVDPRSGERVVVSVSAVPLRAEDGRITGVLCVFPDVTARRRAEDELRALAATLEERVEQAVTESEQAQSALLQAQKLETIGQLTGGVAHDFNNVLASITGNLDLIRANAKDRNLERLIDSALRSAERGAKLIEQLLAYARKQRLEPKPVDLNIIVRGLVEMLGRTLGSKIQVRTDLAPDLLAALVDPTQMELVLLNLAINARDAMPSGGSVLIRTRNAWVAAGDGLADLVPGEYVVLSVADTGTGMSAEVLARAFEPFFTTKEPGKGSGLGLSQIHGLAHQSGGTVRLLSRLGEGTEVQIYLPRTVGDTEKPAASEEEGARRQGAAMVLVVDDQEDVREVLTAQLETLGHRVVDAPDGRTALNYFAPGRERIDLMIVDYAMPGMTGLELARTVSHDRPDLSIIMVTGYADADLLARLDGLALVRKPYRLTELARHIDAALARR